jgi:hypothetical protein
MASITITTTGAQDTRLTVAFGDYLHPGTNATTADVKSWLISELRRVVHEYETRQAVAAVPPPAAFDPS